eukprot:3308133-Rhodomonas_salina.2
MAESHRDEMLSALDPDICGGDAQAAGDSRGSTISKTTRVPPAVAAEVGKTDTTRRTLVIAS